MNTSFLPLKIVLLFIVLLIITAIALTHNNSYNTSVFFTGALSAIEFQDINQTKIPSRVFVCSGEKVQLHWQIYEDISRATIEIIDVVPSQCSTASPGSTATNCPPRILGKTTLYVLNTSTPQCPDAQTGNTVRSGCIPATPKETTLYSLSIERRNGGWAQYQAVIEVVQENHTFFLNAHNSENNSTWSASIRHVDPNIYVKQAQLHPVGANTITESGAGIDLWELSNDKAPSAAFRIMGLGSSHIQGNVPLAGNYSLTPIDQHTNKAVSRSKLDTTKDVFVDMALSCKKR
jgi:hypothetical protein